MKPWRNTLYLFGLALGVFLLLYQIYIGSQNLAGYQISFRSILLLIGAFLVAFVAYMFQMLSWFILMKALGVVFTWKDVTRGYLLSFLPRYIPGTIWGYLSRGEWLYRSYKIPYGKTNLGSGLEILVALLTGTLVVGFSQVMNSDGYYRLFLIAGLILLPWITWVILTRLPSLSIVNRTFSRFFPLQPLRNLTIKQWLVCHALYLGQWLVYGGVILLIYLAINPHQGVHGSANLFSFTAVYSLAWMAGFIVVFFPAGLGLRELALTYLLVSTFSLLLPEASTISVASRLLLSLAELSLVVGSVISRTIKPSGLSPET